MSTPGNIGGNISRSAGRARQRPAADRHRQALDLRFKGLSYAEIADALGYADRASAYKAVQRAAAELPPIEDRETLRQLEAIRLDALQAAVWPAAMKGDDAAIRDVLAVMARRAKLLGLDAPTKLEHRITEDLDQEIEDLIRELSELGSVSGERSEDHPG